VYTEIVQQKTIAIYSYNVLFLHYQGRSHGCRLAEWFINQITQSKVYTSATVR